jgi:hypothetical protein
MILILKNNILLLFTSMIVLCTAAFSVCKIFAANADMNKWLKELKTHVINCDPNGSVKVHSLLNLIVYDSKKAKENKPLKKTCPIEKNNGNGCAHQLVTCSICSNNSKRRGMKNHLV